MSETIKLTPEELEHIRRTRELPKDSYEKEVAREENELVRIRARITSLNTTIYAIQLEAGELERRLSQARGRVASVVTEIAGEERLLQPKQIEGSRLRPVIEHEKHLQRVSAGYMGYWTYAITKLEARKAAFIRWEDLSQIRRTEREIRSSEKERAHWERSQKWLVVHAKNLEKRLEEVTSAIRSEVARIAWKRRRLETVQAEVAGLERTVVGRRSELESFEVELSTVEDEIARAGRILEEKKRPIPVGEVWVEFLASAYVKYRAEEKPYTFKGRKGQPRTQVKLGGRERVFEGRGIFCSQLSEYHEALNKALYDMLIPWLEGHAMKHFGENIESGIAELLHLKEGSSIPKPELYCHVLELTLGGRILTQNPEAESEVERNTWITLTPSEEKELTYDSFQEIWDVAYDRVSGYGTKPHERVIELKDLWWRHPEEYQRTIDEWIEKEGEESEGE